MNNLQFSPIIEETFESEDSLSFIYESKNQKSSNKSTSNQYKNPEDIIRWSKVNYKSKIPPTLINERK